ncbi:hypothetical protein FS837_008805 [Tulasnella sp. UAMH 9824]|nr:hypothetical protein FS837_008805 [Tulasnella sp. UAMH 9824]
MATRGRIVPVLFAGAVGVISGVYIWKPLLEQELKEGPKGLEQLSVDKERSPASAPPAPAPPSAEPTPSTAVHSQEPTKTPDVNVVANSRAPSTTQQKPSFKRDVGQDQSVSVLSWSRWFGEPSPSSATNSDPDSKKS